MPCLLRDFFIHISTTMQHNSALWLFLFTFTIVSLTLMFISSPVKKRAVVDIRATAEAHRDIAADLLAIYGLSGADTIASLHGIGKGAVLKVYKD